MTIRDPQVPSIAGITPTFHAAAGGGDKVLPGSLLHIINADAAPTTLTIVTPGTAYGQAIADAAIVVAAGAKASVLIPSDGYTGSDGYASLSWSNTTSITFSVEKAWTL